MILFIVLESLTAQVWLAVSEPALKTSRVFPWCRLTKPDPLQVLIPPGCGILVPLQPYKAVGSAAAIVGRCAGLLDRAKERGRGGNGGRPWASWGGVGGLPAGGKINRLVGDDPADPKDRRDRADDLSYAGDRIHFSWPPT